VLGLFLWRCLLLEELVRRPGLARLPRGPGHLGRSTGRLLARRLYKLCKFVQFPFQSQSQFQLQSGSSALITSLQDHLPMLLAFAFD